MKIVKFIFPMLFITIGPLVHGGSDLNVGANGKRPLIIAVIDTGFGYLGRGKEAKLCKFGHRNFTADTEFSKEFDTITPVPVDHHRHGTNVAGTIDKYVSKGDPDYCLVIIKFYDPLVKGKFTDETIRAINYATSIKADIINYSAGGTKYNEKESLAVKKFLDQGGIFVAAAGNDGKNLDKGNIDYYPAMLDSRVISVGNLQPDGVISHTSNYGNIISQWETGEQVEVYGISLSGTSQAAAVVTGKIAFEIKNTCHRNKH